MTNIDDSNTTPPGYWFGELNGRLRDRMRDELHDLDLGRRGWRILHTLADGPATAEDLAAALPRPGRHDRAGRPGRTGRPDHDARRGPYGADHRNPHDSTDQVAEHGSTPAAAAGQGSWRGRPDWMRREWERRQDMYRAWMEHDREHPHPDPRDLQADDPGDGHGDGPWHGYEHPNRYSRGHGYEHGRERGAEHQHGEYQEHGHHDHGPHEHRHHSGGQGSQQAFERGFERGFVHGFERGTPFGPGRFAPGGFGPGGFGPGGFAPGGFGRGRFGHGPDGQAHGFGYGHDNAPASARRPFAGRGGCRDHVRAGVDRILADFVERGWVWFDGDTATLTDEGRSAHDAAFERIRALRASVAEGIDPADLATTMATLEAMARNLGWAPPTPEPDAEQDAEQKADPTSEARDVPSAEQTPPTRTADDDARSDDPATD